MRKLISLVLCLAMVLGSAASAFADTSKGTATTLRLEKTEGKVGLTKTGGKAVTIKEGIRLYDGYAVNTKTKSAAYISLDASKAIMMDASTDVSIKKNGKKLDIMLKSGTILVDVEDKLKGNEELNIRTTNSVTGIRGTIVQEKYNPKTGNSEIYVIEGKISGKYQAPDGSWYEETLSSGSWLASGMGMLADNPDENGWKYEEDHWVYTNNDIESTGGSDWCWSQQDGWYTEDEKQSSGSAKQEAGSQPTQENGNQPQTESGKAQEAEPTTTETSGWSFTFTQLEPKVQQEIIEDEAMLQRTQESPELYPELTEAKLEETKKETEKALTAQQEEAEQKEAAIEEAFTEGNGGNAVDNLFEEQKSAPAAPTYMVRFYDISQTTVIQTRYYHEGDLIEFPYEIATGYILDNWMYYDESISENAFLPEGSRMGTKNIDCWPTSSTPKDITVHLNFVSPAAISLFDMSGIPGDYVTSDPYTFKVPFQQTLTLNLAGTLPTTPTLKVTDAVGNTYPVNKTTGEIPIKITGGSGVEITIEDITGAAQNTYQVVILDPDEDTSSTTYAEIVGYSGDVVAYSYDAVNNRYDVTVSGGNDATITVQSNNVGGKQYGIRTVYNPSGTPTVVYNIDYFYSPIWRWEYTITSNAIIQTGEVHIAKFGGDTNSYAVTNHVTKVGDNYYFAGNDSILLTTVDTATEYQILVMGVDAAGNATRVMPTISDGIITILPDATDGSYYPTYNVYYSESNIYSVSVDSAGSVNVVNNTPILAYNAADNIYYVAGGTDFFFQASSLPVVNQIEVYDDDSDGVYVTNITSDTTIGFVV